MPPCLKLLVKPNVSIYEVRILLVGCGKMGESLVGGWFAKGIRTENICVVEPNRKLEIVKKYNINVVPSIEDISNNYIPQIVVFAVKPQAMDLVCPPYSVFKHTKTVFVSIAAGRTIEFLENNLGKNVAIIRVMPNTPAAIGCGISVACGNKLVTVEQRKICLDLLAAVGESVWLEEENLLDPVTAVSGSGPAYVFLLMEALASAGINAGLDPNLAEKLAKVTVAGSGKLAVQSSDSFKTLRENVTSPGGTTAAAVEVLLGENGMQNLIENAVKAATARSRELAG